MPKKRMDVNWKREIGKEDLKPAVKRYRRYLEDKGLRASTIPMYVLHVSKYLEFAETDSPCADDFAKFRDLLHDKKLSRSTINNYSFTSPPYDAIFNITCPIWNRGCNDACSRNGHQITDQCLEENQ